MRKTESTSAVCQSVSSLLSKSTNEAVVLIDLEDQCGLTASVLALVRNHLDQQSPLGRPAVPSSRQARAFPAFAELREANEGRYIKMDHLNVPLPTQYSRSLDHDNNILDIHM